MQNQNITERCIQSLKQNSQFRHAVNAGNDQEQRDILQGWYYGFNEASGTSSQPSTSVEQFITTVLPEVRKAA